MRRDVNESNANDCDVPTWNGNSPSMTSMSAEASVSALAATKRPAMDQDRVSPRERAALAARENDVFQSFRRICSELRSEIARIDDYLQGGRVTDEGLEVIVEVEHLLERLFDCQWGEGDALKRVVVAVQAQVTNAEWTSSHVGFLRDVVRDLNVAYVINDAVVDECYRYIESHGLEQFRGTIAEPAVRKKYRIQEVSDRESD